MKNRKMGVDLITLSSRLNKLQVELNEISTLPLEVKSSKNDFVLPRKMFENTRGYILQIVDQINLCYENTCYDASAVMIRRLIEILIIEMYDKFGAENDICDIDGNYYYLEELINKVTSSALWKLGRNTKSGLRNIKNIGDQSAHSRRYNAKRTYIDELIPSIRTVSEEFLYLSGLRK